MSILDQAALEAIRARAEKAKAGPWSIDPKREPGDEMVFVWSPGFIAAARSDVPALLASHEALWDLARELAHDLVDCIDEVEGKAYLKDYVKAGYDDTLAKARAAGLLEEQS